MTVLAARRREYATAWTVAALLLAAAFAPAQPQPAAAREPPPVHVADVHAAYVLNFVRYTRWPAPADPGRPLRIAILGDRGDARPLLRAVGAARVVEGRPLVVRTLSLAPLAPSRGEATAALRRGLDEVDVVYVGEAHGSWAPHVVDVVGGRPVLTIGTGAAFARAGGMFALLLVDGRVVFAANVDAIRASGVEVSSRVLALARPLPEGDG